MPHTVFDQKKKFNKLMSLLRGTADVNGKNFTDLGNMVGVTSKTITERFKHPENITLDELTRIGRGLNIPIEELRQCIMY